MSDSVRPHRWQPTRLSHPWHSPGKNTGVGCHFLLQGMKVKSESEVAKSCLTLSDPMDSSPPGSSIHGIFQARVLEWCAIAFSRTMATLKSCSWADCTQQSAQDVSVKLSFAQGWQVEEIKLLKKWRWLLVWPEHKSSLKEQALPSFTEPRCV